MSVASAIWHRYVTETIELADEHERASRADDERRATTKMVVVLITSALALTAISFGSRSSRWLVSTLDAVGLDGVATALQDATADQLGSLAFWATMSVVGYVVPALFAITVVLREPVAGYGLSFRGIGGHFGLYLGLLAVSVPFVVGASFSRAFQAKYPFYDLAPDEALFPTMAVWWVLYAAQFVALEFFFRGFMVHGLKDRIGYAAIFVMLVPYNMIHFQKPLLEALAAIGGGAVLGSLSLRSGSIWWGAALHIGVAATMDVLSLAHKGFL